MLRSHADAAVARDVVSDDEADRPYRGRRTEIAARCETVRVEEAAGRPMTTGADGASAAVDTLCPCSEAQVFPRVITDLSVCETRPAR